MDLCKVTCIVLQVGDHSYTKFLTETPLIRDEKLRNLAIDRTTKDILEFKRLRLKSEARKPPLDQDGNNLYNLAYVAYVPSGPHQLATNYATFCA